MPSDPPFRILPRLDDHNREFWTGGAAGELRFWRCQDCGYYIHPPQPICPIDFSKNLAVVAVSGKATLTTYSVNHQNWMPGPDLPYVVAIVEIVEQPSVRLTTNLVNCPLDEIQIGMPVRVTFEHHPDPDGDVYLPLFEPDDGGAACLRCSPTAHGARANGERGKHGCQRDHRAARVHHRGRAVGDRPPALS